MCTYNVCDYSEQMLTFVTVKDRYLVTVVLIMYIVLYL